MVKNNDTNVIGFSRGLLSTWTFLPDYNLLFDAGDGVSAALGQKSGSIAHIVLTHAHFDHVGGLAALLHLRSRVAPNNPVNLYLPGEHSRINTLLGMLGKQAINDLNIIKVEPDKEYPIGGKRILRPFNVRHSPISKGYLIQEPRAKLLPEYQKLSGKEIAALRKNDIKVMRDFHHTLVAYTGDTAPMNKDEIHKLKNADLLITEATFLTTVERLAEGATTHNDLENVTAMVAEINPKRTIINHVSPRYFDNRVQSKIEGLGFECILGEKHHPTPEEPSESIEIS